MTRALAVALLVLAACGGNGVPDQGTVRTCFNTIGVKEPDATSLGSMQGWINVGEQAVTEAKHEPVRTAGEALKAALAPAVQQGGIDQPERARYIAAVTQMVTACKESNAFEGDPRA